MQALRRTLKAFKVDRKGATAVEYGLIMALMTVAIVGALGSTGKATQDTWQGVADEVTEASGDS